MTTMNEDDRNMPAADEQDAQFDPLPEAIAGALANRILPPLPDIDADAAAIALTEAERLAMASLGSSEEFVNHLVASLAVSRRTSKPGDDATHHAAPDATIPLPQMSLLPGGDLNDPTDLLARLDAVQTAEQIRWTSSYRKLQELGRGGQGVVYLTECLEELSGVQAVKIYSPLPYGNAAEYREDMRRLLDVALRVHRIHHDNLVGVLRFVDYQGIFVMVMQWIDGFDLRRLLNPQLLERLRQRIDPNRWTQLDNVIYARPGAGRVCLQPLLAVNIVEECLRGLSALHEKGIVHGDIKPSNIMLDCNGSIRLIDIGSACSFNAPPRRRIWTPRYAPPEFLERGEWTPKSDLASLGYVLIELMSGRQDVAGPLIGDDSTRSGNPHRDDVLLEAKRCMLQRLPDLLPDNVLRCEKLVRLCRKLVDPDPKKRFANASEAIDTDDDGTWHFRMDLVRSDLAVHEANAIQRWVADVKKVTP